MLLIVVFDAVEGGSGPFTIEMSLPHIAPTMVDIDFDCNNLCLALDYPKDISMRIPHLGLTIPQIITRILEKKFYVCKHRDNQIKKRVDKMTSRGWKDLGDKIFTPGTEDGFVRQPIETPVPADSEIHRIVEQLKQDVGGVTVVRVFRLQND